MKVLYFMFLKVINLLFMVIKIPYNYFLYQFIIKIELIFIYVFTNNLSV